MTAVAVFNPITLILALYFIGLPASQLVPSCRTRTFVSGEHRHFIIGMMQNEAAVVVAREGHFPIRIKKLYAWPRNTQELAAMSEPDANWRIGLGNTCVVQSRSIEPQFTAGRLVKITENVDVNWL